MLHFQDIVLISTQSGSPRLCGRRGKNAHAFLTPRTTVTKKYARNRHRKTRFVRILNFKK